MFFEEKRTLIKKSDLLFFSLHEKLLEIGTYFIISKFVAWRTINRRLWSIPIKLQKLMKLWDKQNYLNACGVKLRFLIDSSFIKNVIKV